MALATFCMVLICWTFLFTVLSHDVSIGSIVLLHPPPPSVDNFLSVVSQPFSVVTSVELTVGVDYTDWKHCYSISNSGFSSYCSLIIINDSVIQFSPISGQSPPEFDMLDPLVSHRISAWFESVTNPNLSWGLQTFEFKVTKSPVRTKSGDYMYFENNPTNSIASEEKSYSISGLIVEPRDHQNIPVVIRNVIDHLPVVRPIHLFHGSNYDPCQKDQFMCDLIRDEVVVPHRLIVDNLSFMDYNRLLLDNMLWRHIRSEKVLVFQTDTIVCSLSSQKLVRDFSHLDYVGANQVVSFWVGSPPEFIEEELFGGNGGFSLRDVKLSKICVEEKRRLGMGRDQEDVFFPTCIAEKGGQVASIELQRSFATYREPSVSNQCSLGAHKIDTNSKAGADFINYCCPGYAHLLTPSF